MPFSLEFMFFGLVLDYFAGDAFVAGDIDHIYHCYKRYIWLGRFFTQQHNSATKKRKSVPEVSSLYRELEKRQKTLWHGSCGQGSEPY